jgi:class 3 adenylate cyclase
LEWELDFLRMAYERLAERATVIRYDWRGLGLSERGAVDFSAEAAVRDLEAVLDRLGLDRFAIYCNAFGGTPFSYLAEHAERVSHLIITVPAIPPGFLRRVAVLRPLIEQDLEAGTEVFARLLGGWDNPQSAQMAAWLRGTTRDATTFATGLDAMAGFVPESLAAIRSPTLILHRPSNDGSSRVAASLAGTIAGAHMVGIAGLPFGSSLNETMVTVILDFINAVPTAPGRQIAAPQIDISAVRTIVFTDVEDSTALNERLGDEGARAVLREHERLTREALGQHGGSEVKAMGDGFMAWFPSATRALECAIALQRALDERNAAGSEAMLVRIGINAGEPIAEGDDLFGASVIAAARISARAKGGQILASDVVRQLLAGKGFIFGDQGEHSLKGFDEPVRLFEVSWR